MVSSPGVLSVQGVSRDHRTSRVLAEENPKSTSRGEVTLLLESLRQGHAEAREDLVILLYEELRRAANNLLQKERKGHTLHPTEIVHEAYFRLFDRDRPNWENRRHFLGSAAIAMRRVLIDHARRKDASKRIPVQAMIPLEDAPEISADPEIELLALDKALNRLAKISPRYAQVVELRYFGGLTESETAEVLEISRQTVARDWRTARLWLRREMNR